MAAAKRPRIGRADTRRGSATVALVLLAAVIAGCDLAAPSPTPLPYSGLLDSVRVGRVVRVEQYGRELLVRLTDGRQMIVLVPNILTDVNEDIARAATEAGLPPPPFENMPPPGGR